MCLPLLGLLPTGIGRSRGGANKTFDTDMRWLVSSSSSLDTLPPSSPLPCYGRSPCSSPRSTLATPWVISSSPISFPSFPLSGSTTATSPVYVPEPLPRSRPCYEVVFQVMSSRVGLSNRDRVVTRGLLAGSIGSSATRMMARRRVRPINDTLLGDGLSPRQDSVATGIPVQCPATLEYILISQLAFAPSVFLLGLQPPKTCMHIQTWIDNDIQHTGNSVFLKECFPRCML